MPLAAAPAPTASDGPRRTAPRLRLFDVVAMIVGVVVGAGIFRAPSLVAGAATSELGLAALWVLGGVVSLAGALCYGELVSAFPSRGGEYHFLTRAYGPSTGFLFAWSRLTVTCTGSIALLAFVFGDYATALLPLGEPSSAIYAGAIVIALTALNARGLRVGSRVQNALILVLMAGAIAIAIVALAVGGDGGAPAATAAAAPAPTQTVGLAMVFVLLTFGGWNEAAYLSAEVDGGRRRTAFALVIAVGVVTGLYLLLNLGYVRVLGIDVMRGSDAVAADMAGAVLGPVGVWLIGALIAAAAVSSINATIVTCSRTGYAFGRQVRLLRPLGGWDERTASPRPALLLQGGVVLILIAIGALARRGFETMVEYTAPVFWAFFLLTGLAVFVLRAREPHAPRPFRVPLYPLTPIVFCGACAWLLWASLAHTGPGAAIGIVILLVGFVPLWLERRRGRATTEEDTP